MDADIQPSLGSDRLAGRHPAVVIKATPARSNGPFGLMFLIIPNGPW